MPGSQISFQFCVSQISRKRSLPYPMIFLFYTILYVILLIITLSLEKENNGLEKNTEKVVLCMNPVYNVFFAGVPSN